MELSKDVGHIPIVLIRFNPDDYELKEDETTSCWGVNKNGICGVKKSKQIEWNEILNVLHLWTFKMPIFHTKII